MPGLLAQDLETQRDGVVVITLDVPDERAEDGIKDHPVE
jgi:hypothetical protein